MCFIIQQYRCVVKVYNTESLLDASLKICYTVLNIYANGVSFMAKRAYITDESANLITIRDPMIVVVGDTYYLTGTQPPYWGGVNDGVHLWSSKDLVHFTDHGLILKRADMPEEMWCRDRFWAPELFAGGNGFFYLTFNCKNESEAHRHAFGVGLARAREITGPYEIMTVSEPLSEGIDGTLFRDDDGAYYIGRNGHKKLFIHSLDIDRGEEGEWDSIGIEGQCILKRQGIYFQWYSSRTNGYNAGLMTASSIHGPWVKSEANPILRDNEIWHHSGHNHSFRGLDGKDYIVFHANSSVEGDEQIERMFIREVEYKDNGTVEIK